MRKYTQTGYITLEQCEEKDCSICKSILTFLNDRKTADYYYKIKGLAKGNLTKHLNSGKHWKHISFTDRKSGETYPY